MIKLKEILENPVPSILYHATFRALLNRIQKIGLIPHDDTVIHNFEGIEEGVYLSPESEYAGSMVEASENPNIPEEWFNDIIVMAINTTSLDMSKFDRDPNVAPQEDEYDDTVPADEIIYSYIYRGTIPPSAISGYTKYL